MKILIIFILSTLLLSCASNKKEELIVSDNHDCGGVGVSFSGKYKTN